MLCYKQLAAAPSASRECRKLQLYHIIASLGPIGRTVTEASPPPPRRSTASRQVAAAIAAKLPPRTPCRSAAMEQQQDTRGTGRWGGERHSHPDTGARHPQHPTRVPGVRGRTTAPRRRGSSGEAALTTGPASPPPPVPLLPLPLLLLLLLLPPLPPPPPPPPPPLPPSRLPFSALIVLPVSAAT